MATEDHRQWLTANGFPLGPMGADVDLYARWRGRRLHVSTQCAQYQKMASWRTPVTVTVPAADVTSEHLCHVCGSLFNRMLLSKNAPGYKARAMYLTVAEDLHKLRKELSALEALLPGNGRKELPAQHTAQQAFKALERAQFLAHREKSAQLADLLGPLAEVELHRAQAIAAAVSTQWTSVEGRHAAARLAARDAMLSLSPPAQRRFSTKATWPKGVGSDPEHLKPSFVLASAKDAYAKWCTAIGAGADRKGRLRAAMSQVDVPAVGVGQHVLSQVPVVGDVTPGETLDSVVQRSLKAHANTAVSTLVEAWEHELASLVGDDLHLVPFAYTAGDLSRLPMAVRVSQILASTAAGHWLAVPAAVLRLSAMKPTSAQGALTAPTEVLAAAIALIADGVAAQTALDAALVGLEPART